MSEVFLNPSAPYLLRQRLLLFHLVCEASLLLGFHLYLLCAGITGSCLTCPDFTVVLVIRTLVLTLAQGSVYTLSHPSYSQHHF